MSGKQYADCGKTDASPCNIKCCGNKFGHSGTTKYVKRLSRRYHRHATKNNWKREYVQEQLTAEQDILIICGFYDYDVVSAEIVEFNEYEKYDDFVDEDWYYSDYL